MRGSTVRGIWEVYSHARDGYCATGLLWKVIILWLNVVDLNRNLREPKHNR